MTAAKRIMLALWLVLVGAIHAPAAILHADENRVGEKIGSTPDSRLVNASQVVGTHQQDSLPAIETVSGCSLAAKETTTVIGRVKDLQKLGLGEKSLLDRLPDLGSPKANWKQNSGVLRQEMNRGLPIRDASVGDTRGQFLNAERNLLRDRGWTFDGSYWNPPAP